MRNGFFKLACLPLVGFLAACSATPAAEEDSASESASAITATEQGAYNYFLAKGLTSYQAAGIVGNLMQESNVNPGSVEPGGPGRGIAQWSLGGRWNHDHSDNLLWYASAHGESASNLTTQLNFIWYELETFADYGLARLRASRNVTEATVIFQTDFEACGSCVQSTRIRYAKQILASHGSGGGGTTDSEDCYSATLKRQMPHNACVQSASNNLWYQCANGVWTDRWTDPDACDGVHPL